MVKNFLISLYRLLSSRILILSVIFMGLAWILVVRIFQLQIVNGESYLNDYLYHAERTLEIPSSRGLIYDRKGKVLAYNELAHAVVIADEGNQNNQELNQTIYDAIALIEKNGDMLNNDFKISIDENGNFSYTTTSDISKLSFLRDVYGKTSIDDLDTKDEILSDNTAQEVFRYLAGDTRYHIYNEFSLSYMNAEEKQALLEDEDITIYSKEDALKIMAVRMALSANSYQRYMMTTIASGVNENTVAAIKEYQANLPGVTIEEETIRRYVDSIYYTHIIGYTGKADQNDIEELNQNGITTYNQNDIVGKLGIEQSLEYTLQGTKGSQTVYVDSMGGILEVASEQAPDAGNDIYLTIDDSLQQRVYRMLEQYLAGILVTKIVNRDVPSVANLSASQRVISIKDAYYALFNNNIVDIAHLSAKDASSNEQEIYQVFLKKQEEVIQKLTEELLTEEPVIYRDLSEEYQVYMSYIFTMLEDTGLLDANKINTSDPTYLAWKRDDSISLQEVLRYAITQNWLDTSKLIVDSKYSDTQEIYDALLAFIQTKLQDETGFSKRLYKYMIMDYTISPNKICLLLYDQNIIAFDEEKYQSLQNGSNTTAYNFFIDKIRNLEITPDKLALDPCSGSVCMVDPNTGEVLAMVTYPSYDNNRLSGSIDADYWSALATDASNAKPLINRATMTRTAPGSTYKMIAGIAALEEGIVTPSQTIKDLGIFERLAMSTKCWIYPGSHGNENVHGAIRDSCNYFFCELGYLLSLNETGAYDEEQGVNRIAKYAEMFGFGETSGVELMEYEPQISDEIPMLSAMGQGTNNYTNIQLARYVATIANGGHNYYLTLLNKTTDSNGQVIESFTPNLAREVALKESTWEAIQSGMYAVVQEGSVYSIFHDLPVKVAGKTGTAQENAYRAHHSLFIGYAPYENPEIAVSVLIPNGYTSSYAAEIAKNAFKLYYEEPQEQEDSAKAITPGSTIVYD